jgi:tripartite-type tricarboxylate transporter receptor subunit TctC
MNRLGKNRLGKSRLGARRFGVALCTVATGLLLGLPFASSALAQAAPASWPQRPVKFIVSLGPGSGADICARLLAERLATRWGQPVVVENRPGGDAVVAINAFIGARDDHVLLYTPTSSFTAHPYQHDKLLYDPRELTPVARVSNTLVGFVVPSSLAVGTVADLIAMIRAQPGKLNYTTATGMTDVIYDGYFKSAGLAITRVPYRDVVAPLTDLGEGRIQAYVGALAIEQPHMQAGRVKLIAITNNERAPTYPDMPTIAQAGFPALTFDGLAGLFGPKEMAASVRDRIAADLRAVLADPAVTARFIATGQLVSPGTAAEFAVSIDGQRAKLAAVAGQLGLKTAQ